MWLKKAVVRGEGLRDFFFWYVVRSSLSDCTLRFLYRARKRAVCGDEEEELCRIWIYPEEGGGGAGRKDGGRGAGNRSDTVGCTAELDMDERWTQNA